MNAAQIAALNDAFRKSFFTATDLSAGRWHMTEGVCARGVAFQAKAIGLVHDFDVFKPDNDPYGEHDFGSI